MYYGQEDDERDPFDDFGETELTNELADDFADDSREDDFTTARDEPSVVEPTREIKVKTGFSWAAFIGGSMAFVWLVGAIAGPLFYFGVEAVMIMDPAMQAGLIAAAFAPALLFWVAASAAGEALKARKLAVELTRIAREAQLPVENGEAQAQRITETVKNEIEHLNDAVASALDRLAELETAAQRNAAMFGEAVAASRQNTQAMADTLIREREALVEVKADIKDQTDVIANSIGRQIRLMREASKLVKTEVTAAEQALETHLHSFSSSANMLGEHTSQFHAAADSATAAASSLNGSMNDMLQGLAEATRLTDAAKKSTAEAVLAANETASAVRETTRSAVFEAKRAAQLIRAEAQAMQEAANDTMSRLNDMASTVRPNQAAQPVAKKAAVATKAAQADFDHSEELNTLHAAANAAVSRGGSRPRVESRMDVTIEREPKKAFKGFGSWGNFMPQQREEAAPVAANESAFELADFGRNEPVNNDASIQSGAIDLVTNAGVDLDDVLDVSDLDRIARCSRDGASARRRAVVDAAPGAVTRLVRHMKRNADAQDMAIAYRSRPDLAKSEKKGEGSELVRAYLLIDAALA